jgi:uncharacterized membrane protein
MKRFKRLSSLQQLLFVFLLFIVSMLVCRILYSGSLRYTFLLWNLFLAWIPFQLSLFLGRENKAGKNIMLLLTWLLFFPNALYIVTDLIHLEAPTNVPLWFDVLFLLTAAITGLIMAFASLYQVEIFLAKTMSLQTVNRLVMAAIFLGSFGVYLGRFQRWNSWDVLSNPLVLFQEISLRFLFPFEHYRTWGITFLLTAFFSLLYFGMKKMPAHNPQ